MDCFASLAMTFKARVVPDCLQAGITEPTNHALCAMTCNDVLCLLIQQVHTAEEGSHVRLERIARNATAFDFFAVRLQDNAA